MISTNFDDLIKPMLEIWKNLNYRDVSVISKLNIIIKNKKLIHNFDSDIDNLILNAINYYDNLNSFVIFGKDKKNAYKYYLDFFSKDYSLYGIKYLNLNSSIILKIMYQLLFPRNIFKTKSDLDNYISDKYKFLSEYKDGKIDITILFLCKRDLHKKYPDNDINDDNFCIFIPNTKEEITHCVSVFFSQTTLNFLELQSFDYFLTKDSEKCKKMFLKYRNWLNNNIDPIYHSQFMCFSSVVLYLLGNRLMNDLDLYIHSLPKEVEEKIEDLKTNQYNYIEIKAKNTDSWPSHWNKWLDEWAQKCGAKYFEEILGNPKYHFYFLGIKIISLDCDIVRRIQRNRPRAFADLIALRKRYPIKISIPKINDISYNYVKISDKTEKEIRELIEKGGILNEENKEVCIENKTDINKFINTIIYALHTRYRMVFTKEDIKKELNIYDINNDIFNDRKVLNLTNNFKKSIKINIKKTK